MRHAFIFYIACIACLLLIGTTPDLLLGFTIVFIPGAAAGALVWRDSWAPVSTDHLRVAVTPRAGV